MLVHELLFLLLLVFSMNLKAVSALQLNIKKTHFIPLWKVSSMDALRNLVRECCPCWGSIQLSTCGKYLGVMVGPSAFHCLWSTPVSKFKFRLENWLNPSLGNFWNILLYQRYVLPCLTFFYIFFASCCAPQCYETIARSCHATFTTWPWQLDYVERCLGSKKQMGLGCWIWQLGRAQSGNQNSRLLGGGARCQTNVAWTPQGNVTLWNCASPPSWVVGLSPFQCFGVSHGGIW